MVYRAQKAFMLMNCNVRVKRELLIENRIE